MTDTLAMLRIGPRPPIENEYLLRELYREGAATHGKTPPLTRVTFRFSAGMLIRASVVGGMRQFLDLRGVTYKIREYPGWFESDYHLVVDIKTWEDLNTYTAIITSFRVNHMETA